MIKYTGVFQGESLQIFIGVENDQIVISYIPHESHSLNEIDDLIQLVMHKTEDNQTTEAVTSVLDDYFSEVQLLRN